MAAFALALDGGRPAVLRLGSASTVLAAGDTDVSAWDLAGRPYVVVRDGGTYRRGLDGRVLLRRAAEGDSPRTRRRLGAPEAAAVLEAARSEAAAALQALDIQHLGEGTSRAGGLGARAALASTDEAAARLRGIVSMTGDALARDAARFRAVCGPVGILPPDQYLSVVVRLTEGCTWNACTFCSLYRGMSFRLKPLDELARHAADMRAFMGPSLALRRSLFLGDANALCLSTERLVPAFEVVRATFTDYPLASFVDAWTGRRKTKDEWRRLAVLGLRRVYVGLETGDANLLAWLGKPGVPQDATDLVAGLHEAGIAVGVIVLVGVGGERFHDSHVTATAAALRRMSLRRDDVVYVSHYVEDAALGGLHAGPEEPARAAAQEDAIREQLRCTPPGTGPRVARYDVSEFVY